MLLLPSKSLLAHLAFTSLAAFASPARASANDDYVNPDRPGIADGSMTVGRGHFQIETAFQREFRDGGNDETTLVPTLLRYGFAEKWEVRAEGNGYIWRKQAGGQNGRTDNKGFAPTSIGLKYNFVDAKGSTQPSIGAIVRVFPPSGSGDFKSTRTTGDFRFAADWNFADKWSLNPNVGIGFYREDMNRSYATGLFAATLNFNPSKVVNLFVDAGIQSPENSNGHTSVIIDAGGAFIVGQDIQLDFGVGTGIAGSTPPHPFIAVGFSKRF